MRNYLLALALFIPLAANAQYYTSTSSIAALQAYGGSSGTISHAFVAGYYGAGTPGGGSFDWNSSSTATADNCVVFAATGVSTGRWVRTAGNQKLSVYECGAKGDGSADDSSAEQAALDAVAAGGSVTWPINTGSCFKTNSTLTVTRSMALRGQGALCWPVTGTTGISITASNVMVEDLTLTGPQHASYHSAEDAIHAMGAFHAGAAPTTISNIVVSNVTISNWGDAGVRMQYADLLSARHNKIFDIGYVGIGLESVQHGIVDANLISNVQSTDADEGNAYGIYVSRLTDDDGELTSNPRSAFVTVSNNVIDGVPTWEGLDTHAGMNITFSGNTIGNTKTGIAVGGSKDSSGNYLYAPINVAVSGNSLQAIDNPSTYGITFTGPAAGETPQFATGTITGNVVSNYGPQSVALGAINISGTKGLSVSGNSILYPSPYGMLLVSDNYDLTVSGNTILDPWTDVDSIGDAVGIRTSGNNNVVFFANNTIRHFDKNAKYLLTNGGEGFRLTTGTGNQVTFGINSSDATTYVYDQGNNAIVATRYPSPAIPTPALPLSCTGMSTGTLYNNSGVVSICP